MATSPSNLHCPRCGYDVSGVVPTWTEQCPFVGTCSECGLDYEWVDVFRPDRISPRWSFEHARERLVSRWFETIVRSLWPHKFWTDLRLGTRLRPSRLVWILGVLLAVGWLIVMGAGASFGYAVANVYARTSYSSISFRAFAWLGDPWDTALTTAIWPWRRIGWNGSVLDGAPMFMGLWGLIAPLPFLVLGQSLSRAKCRRIHLLRGWAYQWPGILVAMAVVLGYRAWNMNALLAGGLLLWMDIAAAIVLALWMGWYWWAFTALYLRLPRAWFVAAVLLVTSALGVLVIDWAIAPSHGSIVDILGSMMK